MRRRVPCDYVFLQNVMFMLHTFLLTINLQIKITLVYIPFDNYSPKHHTTPVQMITIPGPISKHNTPLSFIQP